MNRVVRITSILIIIAVVLTACGGAAATPAPAPTQAPAKAEPTKAPEPTKAAAPAATQAPAATKAPEATKATEPTKAAAPAAEDYSKAARKDTVIFDIDGGRVASPDLFNPEVPGANKQKGWHQSMMEPLFILNYETGKIDPWQGESMTANATNDVWTLKLHKGIMWNDGVPMNADDVVWTVEATKKTKEWGDNATFIEWIKEVKKIDDLTVQFTLNKPNPRFQLDNFSVRIWGGWSVLPKHVWENQDLVKWKGWDGKTSPVFSGPYKLVSASETNFVYVRDDNWWGAKTGFQKLPAPKKLIWTAEGSTDETKAAMAADHQLDSVMDITLGAWKALIGRNPKMIGFDATNASDPSWSPDPCVRIFLINNTVKPWDDPDMRWALNMMINRDQVKKIAYEGTSLIATTPFPDYGGMRKYTDLLKKIDKYNQLTKTDVAGAQKILESKGYKKSGQYYAKDGKELALNIEMHDGFVELQRMGQVIAEQLQAGGVNATTRIIAGSTWGDNQAMGNYEAQAAWNNCGSVNEPYATMHVLQSSMTADIGKRANGDQARWKNAKFDQLTDQIGVLPLGDPKIDDLFVQAMTEFYNELPDIPVMQARKLVPFDTTYWTNWPTKQNPYMVPCTWWQSTIWTLVNLKPAQ